jgi:ribosomal protein S27AE
MSNIAHVNLLDSPCPSCGGKLLYSAEKESMVCGHCGHWEQPDFSGDQIVELELPLQDFKSTAGTYTPEEIGQKAYACGGCGAQTMMDPREVRTVCGFCGSNKVNETAFDRTLIRPQGVIPFVIGRQEAIYIFDNWIGKGWFLPNTLEQYAQIENLHGVYLPAWTYDARTESSWVGEAGFHSYDSNNRRSTRYEFRHGRLKHFFNDVVVFGSQAHSQERLAEILPFDFSLAINFDPRVLLGWEVGVSDLDVDSGYKEADQIMAKRIHEMCAEAIGGDTHRNLRIISTAKSDQTFKHLVLPVWMCSYNYNGKNYYFLINGQTGKIDGVKPRSWIKLFFFYLFLGILGIVLFICYVYIKVMFFND